MAERSPFTAPTDRRARRRPPPPVRPVRTGGTRWSSPRSWTAGGVYYAAVWIKSNNKHYVLESSKTDADSQLLMSSVHWNERADQSTVTVSKGAEIAPPLRFDPSACRRAGGRAPAVSVRACSHPTRPACANPPLPPGFTGTPPPPPPMTNVVRRGGPIGSVPAAPGNPSNGTVPNRPQDPGARRQIRPLGGPEPGSE